MILNMDKKNKVPLCFFVFFIEPRFHFTDASKEDNYEFETTNFQIFSLHLYHS